ncbi:hypothetical protein ACP70R_006575 [Stipagrostis hirtigluma subsp. patula]
MPVARGGNNHSQAAAARKAGEEVKGGGGVPEQAAKEALPFSAMCIRISRDSYPNLRVLREQANSSSRSTAAFSDQAQQVLGPRAIGE